MVSGCKTVKHVTRRYCAPAINGSAGSMGRVIIRLWIVAGVLWGGSGASASEDIQAIIEKVTANYQQREALLRRSRGECSIFLERLPPDESLETRLRQEMELNEGGTLVMTGENTATIQWMQRDDRVRFDKLIPVNKGMPSQMFGAKNIRVSYDENISRYHDLSTGIAYLNNPPTEVYDVTGIQSRFNIAKLYEFGGRSLPVALAAISAKGMTPQLSESEVSGIACIRIKYMLEKTKENILQSKRVTTYDLAPSMGYSLLRARFLYTEFWDGSVSRTWERLYSATYSESPTHPGVWLIDTMESRQDMDIRDRIQATVQYIELGVDVEEREFTFEGLGVPDGTIVADKRLPGASMKFLYEDGELVPLAESSAREILREMSPLPRGRAGGSGATEDPAQSEEPDGNAPVSSTITPVVQADVKNDESFDGAFFGSGIMAIVVTTAVVAAVGWRRRNGDA